MQDILNGKRWRCDCADALTFLRSLPNGIARTCVTSPPYFGLRDYGVDGQIGLERTPTDFIARLVEVFREVRRVLTKDGTCWVNMGDSYNAYNTNRGASKSLSARVDEAIPKIAGGAFRKSRAEEKESQDCGGIGDTGRREVRSGDRLVQILESRLTDSLLKNKDLIGVPWTLAFALREDGWFLRQDIIWHKPNPMPESIRDRCTKAHEYIFLLSKSQRYFYDFDAVSEKCAESNDARPRMGQGPNTQYAQKRKTMKIPDGWDTGKGSHGTIHREGRAKGKADNATLPDRKNKRSVWTIPTYACPEAHFATFPAELITPCILAGSAVDDIVLEPFSGSGTTLATAVSLGRRALGCELNPNYMKLIERRMASVTPALPGVA